MMNEKQDKETPFPWMETVIHSFEKSFMSDYDINILAFLHRSIDSEIQFISKNDGRCYTVTRAQALYAELTNLYEHMRLKINQHSDFPNATLSCVKLLSQIIKTGLVLTQGLKDSKWIARSLTAVKLFTGESDLIYDVLLLVNGLKKIYHKPYALILKCVLIDDHHEYIASDPLVYMKIILLFRRLSALIISKDHCITLVTRIRPPSNLISWLLSLNISGASQLLRNLKYKKLAQQLVRKDLPESLLQKIRDMALCPYYFDAPNDEYTVRERTKDPLDMFIIDSSSTFKNHSNKKKLKSLSKKKKPILNNSSGENVRAEETSVKPDMHISYINNYSNLIIECNDTEGLHESEIKDTSSEYNSENDTGRFVLPKCGRLSGKKQKSKKVHQIQNKELEMKHTNKIQDSDDDDSFLETDVPSKKSKKEFPCDNLSFSTVSFKRSVNKNTDVREAAVKKGTSVKSRKKLKSCPDRNLKHTVQDGNNFASRGDAKKLNSAPENEPKPFIDQNNLTDSDEISIIAEFAKDKSPGKQVDIEESKKKKKTSSLTCTITAAAQRQIDKRIRNEGYSSDVTAKNKNEYFKNLSLKEKSVSQTSSPVKKPNNSELSLKETLKNKRPKSSGESDSTSKVVTSKKKIIKKTQNEDFSESITDEYKREYFRNLSLKKKSSAQISPPAILTKNDEKSNLIEPSSVQNSKIESKIGNTIIASKIPGNKIPVDVEPLETEFNTSGPLQFSNIQSSSIPFVALECPDLKNSVELDFSEQNSISENRFNSNNLQECLKDSEKSSSLSSSVSEIPTSHSIPFDATDLKVPDPSTTENCTVESAQNNHTELISNVESITLIKSIVSDNERNSSLFSNISNHGLHGEENVTPPSENLNLKNKLDIYNYESNSEEYTKNHTKSIVDSSKNGTESALSSLQNNITTTGTCSEIETKSQILSLHECVNGVSKDSISTGEGLELHISSSDAKVCSVSEQTNELNVSSSHSVESNVSKPDSSPTVSKNAIICSSKLEEQNTEKETVPTEDNSVAEKLKLVDYESDSGSETALYQHLKDKNKDINANPHLLSAINSDQMNMPFSNDISTNLLDNKIEDICNNDKCSPHVAKDTAHILVKSSDVETNLTCAESHHLTNQINSINSPSSHSQGFDSKNTLNENVCISTVESPKIEEQTVHCENYSNTELQRSENNSDIKSESFSQKTHDKLNEIKSTGHEDLVNHSEDLNSSTSAAAPFTSEETVSSNKDAPKTCPQDKDIYDVHQSSATESENITFPTDSNTSPLKQGVCLDTSSSQLLDSNANECVSEINSNSELDNQMTDEQIVPCDNSDTKISKENVSDRTEKNVHEIKCLNHGDSIDQGSKEQNSCSKTDISSNKVDLYSSVQSETLIVENDNTCNVKQNSLNTQNSINLLVDSQTLKIIADSENISPRKQTADISSSSLFVPESNNGNELKIQGDEKHNSHNENSKSLKNTEKSEENTCKVTNTENSVCQNGNLSSNSSLSLSESKIESDLNGNVSLTEVEIQNSNAATEIESTHNININDTDSENISTEQHTYTTALHSLESNLNETENLDIESEGSCIKTSVSSSELELCSNDVSMQLISEDENLSKKEVACVSSPTLHSVESTTSKPESLDIDSEKIETSEEKLISKNEDLNKDSHVEVAVSSGELESSSNDASKQLVSEDENLPSKEEVAFVKSPTLHSTESTTNKPESPSPSVESIKIDIKNENLIDKTEDLHKVSHTESIASLCDLELHSNDASMQLISEDENLSSKEEVCVKSPTLHSNESTSNNPENEMICNSEFETQKDNNQIIACHKYTLNSKKLETNICEKSAINNVEVTDTDNNLAGVTSPSKTNLLNNSEAIDSSSHIIDNKVQITSQTNSGIPQSNDNCNPSFEASSSEDGLTCDNTVNETKENKSNLSEISKPELGKDLSRSLMKIPTSAYIPHFCENNSYVTFSDISLKNKDRSINVDSGLKTPITHFSSAASVEIFSMYRNDILHDEDKSDTGLMSRDDVFSNGPELSDETKSHSTDHSDEDYDFKQNSSDEEENMNETAKASDVYHTPPKDKNIPEGENTTSDSRLDSSPNKDTSSIGDSDLSKTEPMKDSSKEEIVNEQPPRHSLRLRNKAEIKNKIHEEENLQDSVPKLNTSQMILLDVKQTDKYSHDSNDSTNNDLKASTSPAKSIPVQTLIKTKKPIKKSVLKESSSLRSKLKENSGDCDKTPGVYPLRHSKSRRQKDDSPNLGIDLNKLLLDSPSSSRTTRCTRRSKFVKMLTSNVDSESSNDTALTPKRETRTLVPKPEEEAVQNTPSYNLRNRKSIIAPAKLKL